MGPADEKRGDTTSPAAAVAADGPDAEDDRGSTAARCNNCNSEEDAAVRPEDGTGDTLRSSRRRRREAKTSPRWRRSVPRSGGRRRRLRVRSRRVEEEGPT